ncbi:MAG: Rap1a/Tai family immunity protein [Myxococcota bacterium]|nr:Rap1a/Tai family immunity protein [Myxococcota bacterium]
MTRRAGVAFGLLGLLLAGPAGAAEEDDFEVRTTKQLLNLCTVPADHPRAQAAIHFCHGYLVGAYDYHVASNTGPGKSPFLCPPEPEPSRDESVAQFVEWAMAHPQYHDEPPVETEFRFLVNAWPCK